MKVLNIIITIALFSFALTSCNEEGQKNKVIIEQGDENEMEVESSDTIDNVFRPFNQKLLSELETELDTLNHQVFLYSHNQHELALHLQFRSERMQREVQPLLDEAIEELDILKLQMNTLNTKQNPDLSNAKNHIDDYGVTDIKIKDYLKIFRSKSKK